MKAKCTQLLDALGNPQTSSPWLTLGRIYHVLEVILDVHGRWLLRINGDPDEGLGLFRIQEFEIVSDRIPSTWIVSWNSKGGFALAPKVWVEAGFWERYYDGDPVAIDTFQREMKRIIDADP